MAEDMTPEEVMALLRAFHGRMEDEVFRHGGCLEKFIGDALLATFGVPVVGRRDATDTLACARAMLTALDAWNRDRAAAGLPPLRMGLGLHYGQVVLGDIDQRRTIRDFGLADAAAIDQLVTDTLDDPAIRNSPRLPTAPEARALLEAVAR
jgi:class 3 adenylate cyclase